MLLTVRVPLPPTASQVAPQLILLDTGMIAELSRADQAGLIRFFKGGCVPAGTALRTGHTGGPQQPKLLPRHPLRIISLTACDTLPTYAEPSPPAPAPALAALTRQDGEMAGRAILDLSERHTCKVRQAFNQNERLATVIAVQQRHCGVCA